MQKLFIIPLLIFVTACQSAPVASRSQIESPVMNDLAVFALSLDGTPYTYGGNTPEKGFDCSGFVGYVFQHSLGKSLPRVSKDISRIGTKQHEDELRPGDLVFFNTMHRSYSHVGIYLGNGQFIHSPGSGKSVTVVNMNDRYWRNRYNGARRINP